MHEAETTTTLREQTREAIHRSRKEIGEMPICSEGLSVVQKQLTPTQELEFLVMQEIKEGRFSRERLITRYGNRYSEVEISKMFASCLEKLFKNYADFSPIIETVLHINELDELKARLYKLLRNIEKSAGDDVQTLLVSNIKLVQLIAKISRNKIVFLQDVGLIPVGRKFGQKTFDAIINTRKALTTQDLSSNEEISEEEKENDNKISQLVGAEE